MFKNIQYSLFLCQTSIDSATLGFEIQAFYLYFFDWFYYCINVNYSNVFCSSTSTYTIHYLASVRGILLKTFVAFWRLFGIPYRHLENMFSCMAVGEVWLDVSISLQAVFANATLMRVSSSIYTQFRRHTVRNGPSLIFRFLLKMKSCIFFLPACNISN